MWLLWKEKLIIAIVWKENANNAKNTINALDMNKKRKMREKMDKYANIFYCNPAAIGGIETFIYYIAQKYKEYDITVVYRYADEKQLERLKKHVRCVRYNNQKIKCKKAFFNYNIDIIDNIEAEEYYQIIHGDYNAVNIPYKIDKRITKYLRSEEHTSELQSR